MKSEDVAKAIAQAFEDNHVEMTRHFWDELRADAFVLADVTYALESISNVVDLGQDRAGNPKFEVTGTALDGRNLSVICSFKPSGALLFITIYEASLS